MITSRDNPKLKLVRRLHSRAQRHRLGLFVCEGEDLVDAALAAGLEPVEVLRAAVSRSGAGEAAASAHGRLRPAYADDVEPALLAEVSALGHPPRILAVFRAGELAPFEARPVGLALWHVGDPGNVGTLIRSADAFGAFVALSHGCADPTGPKALRASAGAVFRVSLGRFDEAPGRRVALAAHEGTPLAELDPGAAVTFVLGAERDGLPADVLRNCDEIVTIPTPGPAESLNVAAAGAIALYAWSVAATRQAGA